MGGGPSKADKAELADLERQRNEKRDQNARDADDLRRRQNEQAERMNAELASRNRDLENMRRQMAESIRKNEEELRRTRAAQEQRAAELEAERKTELQKLQNSSDADKKKVTEQFEKRAEELKKQHEMDMNRAIAEREEDKKKRDEDIRKAEAERDAIKKQKMLETVKFRKELNEMAENHRKAVDDHYDKLAVEMEKQTLARIDEIANESAKKLAIADASYAQLQRTAIKAIYDSFYREYMQIQLRGDRLNDALNDMVQTMSITDGSETKDFPYELSGFHSNYNTEAVMMDQQLNSIRQRMNMCFEIPDEFRETLLKPLECFEDSLSNVKPNSIKIILAQQRNDIKALEPIAKSYEDHRAILENAIKDMKSIDYRQHALEAARRASLKSIQN